MSSIENTINKCGAYLQVTVMETEVREERKGVSLIHDTFKQFIMNPSEYRSEFLIPIGELSAVVVGTALLDMGSDRFYRFVESGYSTDFNSNLVSEFEISYPFFTYINPF